MWHHITPGGKYQLIARPLLGLFQGLLIIITLKQSRRTAITVSKFNAFFPRVTFNICVIVCSHLEIDLLPFVMVRFDSVKSRKLLFFSVINPSGRGIKGRRANCSTIMYKLKST